MSSGTAVRVLVGRQRGKRGEIVRIDGRHAQVRVAGSVSTYLCSELVVL